MAGLFGSEFPGLFVSGVKKHFPLFALSLLPGSLGTLQFLQRGKAGGRLLPGPIPCRPEPQKPMGTGHVCGKLLHCGRDKGCSPLCLELLWFWLLPASLQVLLLVSIAWKIHREELGAWFWRLGFWYLVVHLLLAVPCSSSWLWVRGGQVWEAEFPPGTQPGDEAQPAQTPGKHPWPGFTPRINPTIFLPAQAAPEEPLAPATHVFCSFQEKTGFLWKVHRTKAFYFRLAPLTVIPAKSWRQGTPVASCSDFALTSGTFLRICC